MTHLNHLPDGVLDIHGGNDRTPRTIATSSTIISAHEEGILAIRYYVVLRGRGNKLVECPLGRRVGRDEMLIE